MQCQKTDILSHIFILSTKTFSGYAFSSTFPQKLPFNLLYSLWRSRLLCGCPSPLGLQGSRRVTGHFRSEMLHLWKINGSTVCECEPFPLYPLINAEHHTAHAARSSLRYDPSGNRNGPISFSGACTTH